ncbi:DUF4328 domain-containing protein [Sphingomonas sp. RB3P16]|uniref:DUF4328 domain-containing protein n=1 Tax=Parasphingomonas frigoris TaxID=3096163 RepID=UPI002FC8E9F8
MQNLDRRQRLAEIAVLIWLVADFALASSGALVIAGLGGTGEIWSQPALEAVDRTATGVGIAYTLAFIASAVFVSRWIYRASANAHTLSDAMTISPGWSVGFLFVPVASLFKPFQALRETWQVSLSPENPDSVPVPAVMRWWWGLWVLASILGNISFRFSLNAKTISDLTLSAWFDIALLVIDVPMAVLLIVVMRRLTANQRAIVDTRIFE